MEKRILQPVLLRIPTASVAVQRKRNASVLLAVASPDRSPLVLTEWVDDRIRVSVAWP